MRGSNFEWVILRQRFTYSQNRLNPKGTHVGTAGTLTAHSHCSCSSELQTLELTSLYLADQLSQAPFQKVANSHILIKSKLFKPAVKSPA